MTTSNLPLCIIGIVLANKIPYSNWFEPGDETTRDGSTYAIGYFIPDDFSMRFIPATTMGKRSTTNRNTLYGMTPLECASFKRISGSNIHHLAITGCGNSILSGFGFSRFLLPCGYRRADQHVFGACFFFSVAYIGGTHGVS